MDSVLQPRPLVVLGLNVWMGTAATGVRGDKGRRPELVSRFLKLVSGETVSLSSPGSLVIQVGNWGTGSDDVG